MWKGLKVTCHIKLCLHRLMWTYLTAMLHSGMLCNLQSVDKLLFDKWKSMPILYPQEPKEIGNSKYCHLVLYNGFTLDLKAELKRIFGSEAKIDQYVAHLRSLFEIRGEKEWKMPQASDPSRFPEKSYWPSPTACLPSSKLVPMKNILPAKSTPSALDPHCHLKSDIWRTSRRIRKQVHPIKNCLVWGMKGVCQT